jgi:putative hydrolase of the HAD superfamily
MSGRVPPKAITFDFWDTLVRAPSAAETRSARRQRLFDLLNESADGPDDDGLDAALLEVRQTFDRHWQGNTQFSGEQAVALLLDTLRLDGDDAWRQRVVNAFIGVDDPHIPPLTDNIDAVLRELQARDVRVGIICDVGLSPSWILRSFLEHHGVLDAFDHWSFSDEVGVYKPDPVIFAHALEGLGIDDPSAAAHVGDLRRTDVAGALAFGMTAVRYAGSNDDAIPAGEGDRAMGATVTGVSMASREALAPEADIVITDHAELLAALGFD